MGGRGGAVVARSFMKSLVFCQFEASEGVSDDSFGSADSLIR